MKSLMPASNLFRRPRLGGLGRLFLLFGLGFAGFLSCALPANAQERPEDNTLRKFNESVDALIRKVSPSVVQILVTGYGPLEESQRR